MPTRVDPTDHSTHRADFTRSRPANSDSAARTHRRAAANRAMPDEAMPDEAPRDEAPRDEAEAHASSAAEGWEDSADWNNVVDFDAARGRRFADEEAEEDADLSPQTAPRGRQAARGRAAFSGAARRSKATEREEKGLESRARVEKSEAAPPCHWGLYVIAILLTVMSIPLVYSASMAIALDHHNGRADFFLFRQIGYVVVGAVVLVASSLTSARHLRLVVWALYAIALLGLLATDLTPLGLVLGGVRRWMRIGPVQLQFSELAKIALVGVMADFWSRAARFAPKSSVPWAMTALLALPIIAMVFVQPHLSAASLLFALPICIAFYAGVPWQRMMRVGLCLLVVGGAVVPMLKPYQRERVMAHLNFLKQDSDEQGANYQALQGQRALAAGGLFGAGLGGGIYKQGHLPAPHTDFIASSIGEEWGLAGMMFLLFLYGLMIFFCFHTGHCASSSFEALLCAGVGTLLGLQVVGNIGVVTGVLPVTGMPLPLLSYGGSGMICTLLGIGLVLSVSRRYGSCQSPSAPVGH